MRAADCRIKQFKINPRFSCYCCSIMLLIAVVKSSNISNCFFFFMIWQLHQIIGSEYSMTLQGPGRALEGVWALGFTVGING